MKKLTSLFNNITENQLVMLITVTSILLTIRVIYIQHGWINDDSVLYFEVARLFTLGEWKQGFALYNWSFYPALLAVFYQLTGHVAQALSLTSPSIQNIAQGLNVIFFAVTTYSFLGLIRLAGGNKTTMLCGAMLLFGSIYIVGDILPMLLRDQGFWAFLLTSLLFFIKFYRETKLQHALLWQACIMTAMLFRIEAITFLLLLPIILLTQSRFSWRQRCLHLLQANLLTILCSLLLVIALITSATISMGSITGLQTFILLQHNYAQLASGLLEKADVMGISVLGESLSGYALMGLLLTLTGIILVKIGSAAGWLTVALLAYRPKSVIEAVTPEAKRILVWAGILALSNVAAITFSSFILSGRYIIALALILLILSAFRLSSLFTSDSDGQGGARLRRWIAIGITCLLTLLIFKNIMTKNGGHNYEQHAVSYVKSQSTTDNTIFYVSPRARYYAGAPYAGRGYDYWAYTAKAINDGSIQHYDYLLINMDNRHPEREKVLLQALKQHKLIKEFSPLKAEKKIMVFVKQPAIR